MEEEGVLEVLSTEVWPCNFFFNVSTITATRIMPFVHRDAYSASANNRSGLPEISKEESPWGTTSYASFSAGWRNVFQFFMPSTYAFRNPSPEPECPWEDRMQWDVPLDDEHSLEFRPSFTLDCRLQAYRPGVRFDRRAEIPRRKRVQCSPEATFPGADSFFRDKTSLVHPQDYVAWFKPTTDRTQEHLAAPTSALFFFAKSGKELRSGRGRPLKKWVLPQDAEIRFQEETEKGAGLEQRRDRCSCFGFLPGFPIDRR
jgi:hypothetical protein